MIGKDDDGDIDSGDEDDKDELLLVVEKLLFAVKLVWCFTIWFVLNLPLAFNDDEFHFCRLNLQFLLAHSHKKIFSAK